jgi:polysaccharide deacetylase 2 family uncharacterized protein YibQ
VASQGNLRANRYKKNGKGGFALAVFLVFTCLLIIGGYLVQHYQQHSVIKKPISVKKNEVIPNQNTQSSVKIKSVTVRPIVDPVPPVKQDYYTGDIPTEKLTPAPSVSKSGSGKVKLAIVVDDMGSSVQEARSLASIGVPINFAIIPGLRYDREVADFATGQGIEILLHMPMQPKEYPKRRLESNGLLLEQSDGELRNRLNSYLEILPQAAGANNHMGSGFTENSEKMRVVLGALKENKLFFLDSITTPLTVGPKIAAELGMRHARRDVFLDNEQNEVYIRGQIAQAVKRARKTGQAIAICHPHPQTISTLMKILPTLGQQGVVLVNISQIIK